MGGFTCTGLELAVRCAVAVLEVLYDCTNALFLCAFMVKILGAVGIQ